MQVGRRKRTATAVAVAVIGGLLGGAPGALAAPGSPGAPATAVPERDGGSALPAVWPRPQSVRAGGTAVALGDDVTVVTGAGADPHAVAALEGVLRKAGVRTVHQGPGGRGPVILMGGTGAQSALRALRAPERNDLPSGGYRIATGRYENRDTVAVDGVGGDGLFHAVQTLRQLITERAVPGVLVRDWPGTAVRGMTEGFYGRPWSHQQRLAQIDFMGRTKQNRYLYAPGDDPYRQSQWRDPYPAAQRAEFRELAERARRNHVTLAWAVAPAQSMCLASDDDVKALLRKVDSMYALGVRAFQLQFQDVSYSEWHCRKDSEVFGSGPEAAAKAQARVASALAGHLAGRNPEAEPLTLMPTEFYQDGATEYRTALGAELDDRVQVAWTGVGVVPRTITGRELAGARDAFKHPLVTMDNYPVNDYAQDRVFLGPYTGREPAVAAGSAALLANAMEQPSASRIPVFTAADFAWNPKGYRPQESWRAAVNDLAGDDARTREALLALAGNDASSILNPQESAYLRPLLADFWHTRSRPDAAARDAAAGRLRAAFTVMREAPERLRGTAEGRFDDEVRPWLEQLSRYGRAGEAAVDMLQAQARGDGPAAWRASLDLEPLRTTLTASPVKVGHGVLDPFLTRAAAEGAVWTGQTREAGEAARDDSPEGGTYTLRLERTRPVEAVTAMTAPGSGTGSVEAHVPGEGWRPLGTLSPTGWTQAATKGLRTDAVRITWTGAAPTVRSLVPWFADEPQATLDLERGETDAEIGGAPQRVRAVLAAQRPGAVRGALTARAPKGIRVTVPKEITVPRGAAAKVPVDITVAPGTPAGEYRVPLSFAGEERTLTVRAFPRTGGPDLARGAAASSSGDETPDFPASAAVDGDPATRWSSPAEDGAWWQLELPAPTRVGQVVLHWQDAYARKYRIQVSADGRTWRTAATVKDGKGRREAVRMDARDTRFVRVQGDERATRYGYSLFAVEAYAVTAPRTDAPGTPGTGTTPGGTTAPEGPTGPAGAETPAGAGAPGAADASDAPDTPEEQQRPGSSG
ncbi:beta-N-acetylglucosaminidase domain-containing protein [Streptomyces sp. SP18CS02]|uniref:beta-N-acetylglucosaminidase domain-containing protein n=1 Tax=Streptomyces sp. SP18CS02 TaxID=3002531 RepID=UPI002E79DC76|nr:beta-N-acetylglucosaminidase domain-containing protein [Streptomyces sp. SP18CS02]MEE1753659.1 beta-N-acetylglucosaminidase domain-containing protein [Streptomyces sp. SP18CS02]